MPVEWKFVPYGTGADKLTTITLSTNGVRTFFVGRNERTGLTTLDADLVIHISRRHINLALQADGTCELYYVARQDGLSALNNVIIERGPIYQLNNYDTFSVLADINGTSVYNYMCCRTELPDVVEPPEEPPAKRQRTELPKTTNEAMQCCVCLDTYKDPYMLVCGHSFCKECISDKWTQCPYCRETHVPGAEKRNIALNDVVSCVLRAP